MWCGSVFLVGAFSSAIAHEVISNGVDMVYSPVKNLGLVENAGISASPEVVGQAVSIAQIAGIDPETGLMITNSYDLLQFIGSSLSVVETNGNMFLVLTWIKPIMIAMATGFLWSRNMLWVQIPLIQKVLGIRIIWLM